MKRLMFSLTMLVCGLVALGVFSAHVDAAIGTGTLFGTEPSAGNLITIDLSSGAGTVVGPTGISSIPSLAVDPITGTMYLGTGGGSPFLYTVDPTSGATTFVGDSGLGFAGIGGMDFRSDGALFAAVNIAGDGGTGSDHLATIDKTTGAATIIGPFGLCTGVSVPSSGSGSCTIEGMEGIAFDASGNLWGSLSARGAAGAPGLYRIDTTTGAANFVAPIEDSLGNPPSGGVVSLQYSCFGTLYGGTAREIGGAGDGGRLITINPTTGLFSFVGAGFATGGSSLGGLAFELPCGIGSIKPGTPFTPDPSGNGRGVAFDGMNILYYTFTGDTNIYKVTTAGVSMGPIPNPGRTFTCGALSWDGSQLWCGTYDSTGGVWTVNPANGTAVFRFTQIFAPDNCFGQPTGFIDGVAYDSSDNTLWLSDDGGRTIYHVQPNGTPIAAFSTPVRPTAVSPGCNSGIEVAPGGYLELVLIAFDGEGDDNHYIVKVSKDDPAGDIIVSFPTQDPACCEDIAYDPKTYEPRSVLWANGTNNEIKAYDVQVTRTIGYWKNHAPEDFNGTSFLPITLGNDDTDGVCETVSTAEDVEDIMKAHGGQDAEPKLKAQLLAAKLNVAMGDIPPGDLAAIITVIADADDLLGRNGCDPDTGKKGADRAEAQALISALDDFNNKYSP